MVATPEGGITLGGETGVRNHVIWIANSPQGTVSKIDTRERVETGRYSTGEGGRALYGTINPTTGAVTVSRRTASFRDVIRHRNENSDRSYSATVQLQKRFSDGVEFGAGYTYSRTQDLFSLTSSTANSNLRFTVLDGTIQNRNLRTSFFDIPHKVVLSGTANLPFDIRASMVYTGASGSPYAYVVSTDVNADGLTQNDAVYVPRNQGDITLAAGASWAALDSIINTEPCLKAYRGSILPRNACRNPWTSFFDVKLSKVIPSIGSHALELTADIFNLLHMLNKEWGVVRQKSGFEQVSMLRSTGYDATRQRPIYALALPQPTVVTDRWRVQLGARYTF